MRTYSEDEARDVFARAARDQQAAHEAAGSGEGLTLDELQEIGRASGLDPAFVAAAAAGVGLRASVAPPKTLWGMPTELKRSRVLPAPLTDEMWEQTVEALRAEFGGPGITSQIGRTREWVAPSRSGLSTGHSVYVAVRPTPDGRAEVTMEQRGLKDNVKAVPALVLTFGAVAAVFAVLLTLGDFEAEVLLLPALFAAFALLAAAGIPAMRAWARRLDARLEAALDRIDLIARTEAPARLDAEARSAEAPRLDLDAFDLGDDARLDDAAEARTPPRTRTR